LDQKRRTETARRAAEMKPANLATALFSLAETVTPAMFWLPTSLT